MTSRRFHTILQFGAAGLAVACLTATAHAVTSAEMYTSESYTYGRFAARMQFGAGDGIVSSFFLWKDGSEKSGTFWNELDFEKLGADCHLETNAIFGSPSTNHSQKAQLAANLCSGFHTYMYEWTPDYIAWFVDGAEIRRETGASATAFRENATQGMQLRFNIWPGDASFGGNFSPSILPVHQYMNWVEYSSYANGEFKVEWREDFTENSLSSRWLTGNWESPKNGSTHSPENINLTDGYAILSLTADNATGATGSKPKDEGGATGSGGASGMGGAGGGSGTGGAGQAAGGNKTGTGGGASIGGTGGSPGGSTGGGSVQGGGKPVPQTGGTSGVGGASGTKSTGGQSDPGKSTAGNGSGVGGASGAKSAGGQKDPGKSAAGDASGGSAHAAAGKNATDDEIETDGNSNEVPRSGCSLAMPFSDRHASRGAMLAAVMGAFLFGLKRSRRRGNMAARGR